MTSTHFDGPITQGLKTGSPTTTQRGYVKNTRVVNVNATDKAVTVSIPSNTVITYFSGILTSAISGAGNDSTARFSLKNAAGDVMVAVPTSGAAERYLTPSAPISVSGALFEASANLTVALSAQSTSVFTGGGGRAFIEYVTVE